MTERMHCQRPAGAMQSPLFPLLSLSLSLSLIKEPNCTSNQTNGPVLVLFAPSVQRALALSPRVSRGKVNLPCPLFHPSSSPTAFHSATCRRSATATFHAAPQQQCKSGEKARRRQEEGKKSCDYFYSQSLIHLTSPFLLPNLHFSYDGRCNCKTE